MKNKGKTYILLMAVLGIWGIIGYKMILAINPKSPEIKSQQSIVAFNPRPEIEKDTFSIQPMSRDPFLGTIKKRTKATSKKEAIKTVVEWPGVVYGGMIKKQNTHVQVFVINIDGNQYLFKIGQSINDVTLVRGNPKEIVVRYANGQQVIALQK